MSYYTRDNPFAPEDKPLGVDYRGDEYYAGDKMVEIDGDIFRKDELDVDYLIHLLRLKEFEAQGEC